MQKYIKAGLLMLTLVVPVFIFLLLKVFATNYFDLPFYVPERDLLSQKVLIKQGDTVFYKLPDFVLLTLDSNQLNSGQLKGKTLVVSAQKGPCGDTCQKIMNHLGRVARLGETYPDLRILTLTKGQIEISRPQMQDTSIWLLKAIPDFYYHRYTEGLFHMGEKLEGRKTILSHNRFELIDQYGFIRGYYDALDPEEIDRLMVEIKVLENNRREVN